MKKALLLGYLLILSMASPLLAQQPADRGADLEAIRIGYITKKLSLTPDEAKQFWPVYDAYRAEMREVRGEMRETAQTAREDFDVI
jgi:Spy/CpxP family protein refolding chaperone